MTNPARRANLRAILFSLWGFAFLSYLLRTNISVAQQYMARDLHWNDVQVGYIFTAFLTGYTVFQVPAGALGDRFGARLVLCLSGLGWTATTLLTGLVPGLLITSASLSLMALLAIRFLHGLEEASTYPVAMTAVSRWYLPRDHAWVNAIVFTGSTLGAAFAPPLVAQIMDRFGWRAAFYLTSLLPLALALFWWRVARGEPAASTTIEESRTSTHAWRWSLLRDWNVVLLCLSYFLYCYAISIYVYWLFKYLVDVRHLSVSNSGWAASLPWITASLCVPLVGALSRLISSKTAVLTGRRLVAVACLLVAAVLMFVGARTSDIAVALAAIAASVGLLFSTESSYWSTAIDSAPEQAGSVSGLMNLAGNLGGVVSTLAVPRLALRFGWYHALLSGSLLAVLAALCWFAIRHPANHSGESFRGNFVKA